MPPNNPSQFWSFAYLHQSHITDDTTITGKTSDTPLTLKYKHHEENPELQLRIGLQLSKIFANYWGGDIKLMSVDGHGTDAYVRIVTNGLKEEVLTE